MLPHLADRLAYRPCVIPILPQSFAFVNTFFKLFLIFFKKISEGEIPLFFTHLRLLLCNDMNLDRIDLRGIRFSDDTVKGDLHDIVLFEVIS